MTDQVAGLQKTRTGCKVEMCMGMGWDRESHGNGNKTQNWEWEWEGMGNHLSGNGNYLHSHWNLFPKVLYTQLYFTNLVVTDRE